MPTCRNMHSSSRQTLKGFVLCVSECVCVFSTTSRGHLTHFMPSGAQTRSPHPRRRRHPPLDILEPPENDVFIFLHERRRMELRVGLGGLGGGGGPLPVCVSLNVFSSFIRSVRLCTSAQVSATPLPLRFAFGDPPLKGGFHRRVRNHRRPGDCA